MDIKRWREQAKGQIWLAGEDATPVSLVMVASLQCLISCLLLSLLVMTVPVGEGIGCWRAGG